MANAGVRGRPSAPFVFAYLRRVIFVFSVVLISAVALEYMQSLTPVRHGRLIDAFEKLIGGALGIFAARAILWFTPNRRRFQNQPATPTSSLTRRFHRPRN